MRSYGGATSQSFEQILAEKESEARHYYSCDWCRLWPESNKRFGLAGSMWPERLRTRQGWQPISAHKRCDRLRQTRCRMRPAKQFFPRASERRVLPIVGVCISSSHLHIFSSSHLLIFTSSHLQIFSSSHLLVFTSSHLHIFSSSHLHIFSSSHLLFFTSFSHLLIFTSSHLHIFSSSHLHICSSSHLLILPSCPLALSFFSISLLKAGAGAVPTRRHET